MKNPEGAWFGDTPVDPNDKTDKVLGVFHNVAKRYDIMNDVMSGGVHRLWKNRLMREIRPRKGDVVLDLAGGTGDIAFRFAEYCDDITVCDINTSMLEVGRDRAFDKGLVNGLRFVTGNAEKLPFPDAQFDICTIAFGLRNVTRIDDALAEIARVLKPGGRFYCLEFSHVKNPLLSGAYDAYSKAVIPKMGKLIADDAESYEYLIESIRKFPQPQALATRMKQAGFARATYQTLSFGVVAIHTGTKAT